MTDQSMQDLIGGVPGEWKTWLLCSVVALFFLHRQLSVWVGRRPQPEVETTLLYAIGRLSGAVWADSPGSVKPILGRMPSGRITPAGGFRAGDTDPRISGQFPRVGPQAITPGGGTVAGCLVLTLLLLSSACATTAIDKARLEFARTTRAATSTNARFRVQSRAFQEANIRRIGVHTTAAAQWQAEFVVKRAPVEEQIRRCDEILSEASDLLLLSDDVRGVPAAKNATQCVTRLKDMIGKLFDGGL